MTTSVTVDGRTIDLSTAGEAFGFKRDLATNDTGVTSRTSLISGSKYSHVRFGSESTSAMSANNQVDMREYVFAIGNITPTSGADAVPTTGRASYIGDAALNHGSAAIGVESKFDVDFGRKTITGQISNAYQIPLKGTISGASFSGNENGISMQGNFYGPKAAELGGVFRAEHENQSFIGAFGAKKQ